MISLVLSFYLAQAFQLPEPKTIHDNAMIIVGDQLSKYVQAVVGVIGASIVIKGLIRR